MSNMINFQANESFDYTEDNDNLYLTFTLGDGKYAVKTSHVLEIIKLPYLDFPTKLPNNVIGLLNYNNLTINVLDIRFYLGMQVAPYSDSDQLLIVKTDESIFALIVTKSEDIISVSQDYVERFLGQTDDKLIDFLYKSETENISVLNLYSFENLLKKGVTSVDVDIPSLFPQTEESRNKLMQRNQALLDKYKANLVKTIFAQEQYISFSLNSSVYCIRLDYVKEFLKNSPITRIPCAPDYVTGIMTLRGDFVTVINLSKFLNLKTSSCNDKNHVIIIESFDYQIGFLVDEVFDIINVSEELVVQNSYHQTNKYIKSEVILEDKLHTVLNMKNILSDEKLFIEEKF